MDLGWDAAYNHSWDTSAFRLTNAFATPMGVVPLEDAMMVTSSGSAPESSTTSAKPPPRSTARAVSSLSKKPPG
ncbi:unnamed protein product [Aureobasidium uvarum]|uniref:Uncharacterized protein n=1 Tax=Aureobasidium uvarum TaxID=2773716 RepID=A0A9N8KX78_9PEZI|nr:unnamed protein product [Aureobasidium uvarum]